jgi:hypothetical protein
MPGWHVKNSDHRKIVYPSVVVDMLKVLQTGDGSFLWPELSDIHIQDSDAYFGHAFLRDLPLCVQLYYQVHPCLDLLVRYDLALFYVQRFVCVHHVICLHGYVPLTISQAALRAPSA